MANKRKLPKLGDLGTPTMASHNEAPNDAVMDFQPQQSEAAPIPPLAASPFTTEENIDIWAGLLSGDSKKFSGAVKKAAMRPIKTLQKVFGANGTKSGFTPIKTMSGAPAAAASQPAPQAAPPAPPPPTPVAPPAPAAIPGGGGVGMAPSM
jgi:hypothetical protein